jgi:hypothetical protein
MFKHPPTIDDATAGTTAAVAARIRMSSVNTRTTQWRARKVMEPRKAVAINTIEADTLQQQTRST